MGGASTARHAGSSRTDQASERENRRSPRFVPCDPGARDFHTEHTLRVTFKSGGPVRHDVQASARQVDERAQLCGDDTRNRQGGLVGASYLAGHGHFTVRSGQREG